MLTDRGGQMQAVVIDKPGDLSVGEVPDPSPRPDEVVIAVSVCGICGTDLHVADGEYSLTRYPIIPGHEFAGEVVAVGKEVANVPLGSMVTADPNDFCGRCRPCREGHGNLCENFRGLGVTLAGACADYVAVPAWNARSLPEGFDMSAAALIEPLSCAVHGYDLLHPKLGDRFLIYGAGTMGLLLVLLAERVGAISVAVVEPQAQRRELARSFGATAAVENSDQIEGDGRFDVVIDATGVVGAIEDALRLLRRGGTYLQFGVAPAEASATFSPYRLCSDELNFVGSIAVLHSFDRACDLAVNVGLGLERLVSDTLPLASYLQALNQVRHGQGLKVQVAPGRGEKASQTAP
jgi:2-desacetyl-2-hydroxyethyl bacteriochlorophyllide A dehydrogenase